MQHDFRRSIAAFVGVVTVALVGAVTAPATPAVGLPAATFPTEVLKDHVGDTANPHADVTTAAVGSSSLGFAFTLHVKSPIDPRNDVNYTVNHSSVNWFFDTDFIGIYDHFATLTADSAGNLHVVIYDTNTGHITCTGKAYYTAAHDYFATFATGCLGHISAFRWRAAVIYNTPSTTVDAVPDVGYSPKVFIGQTGYWMLGGDGTVYPFGNALHVTTGGVPFATAMAGKLNGTGFWVVNAAGGVHAFGSSQFFGGSPALRSGEFISSMSATPTGLGYWLFSNRGRVFRFGDAQFYGDMSTTVLNGPIVASVATATGNGYYLVGSDGGIFTFGDAKFRGSMGGAHLNKPVVGISPTPDNTGYWLVASDGGVFAFNAPFRGSMGSTRLNQPINGLVAFGNGYLMVASDGGVFDFSNRPFLGSLSGHSLPAPINGIAAFTT